MSDCGLLMVPSRIVAVASRSEEPITASSEIGTEILLYLTRTKEARYEITAGMQTCERLGMKRGIGTVTYQPMCAKPERQRASCV